MSRTRRATYTRASDITIRTTDGTPIGTQRRYSPSELNTIRSNRKPRKINQIIATKVAMPAYRRYLDLANADN